MERKVIILGDGQIKYMTFEEVLEQFDKLIKQFVNSSLNKIVYNKPEWEEVYQELQLQTWEAFCRYNGENAFSTYLYYRLQHGVSRSTVPLYAQKRTNTSGSISLNQIMSSDEGDLEFEGLLGEEDLEICSLGFRDFMSYLEKILTNCEKKMLRVLMDRTDYSVTDFADELKMSRQGANKKINKFKEKLASIMQETGYVL